jgi:hypothetical protein
MQEEIKIDSELSYAEFIRDFRKQWLENKYLIVKVRTGKQRTLTQNRALHLWLGMVADELNAHGMDMVKMLDRGEGVEIAWTVENAKERLWKPVQEAAINKISTTEADRVEYSYVRDILAAHIAKHHGVTLPEWPKKKQEEE